MYHIRPACKHPISPVTACGFTLLEIMVSLVIISVVLVSLLRVQAGSIDLAAAGRFKHTAAFLAATQLGVIEQDLANQTQLSGEFEGDFSRYKWSCEISDVSISDEVLFSQSQTEDAVLKKIDLRITGAGSNQIYDVVTYRYTGK